MRFKYGRLLLDDGATGSSLTGGAPVAPAAGAAGDAPPAEPVIPEGREWLAGVDSDFINDPSMSSIQDLNGLAKSYINAQKMVGKEKFVIPDEHASDDDWAGVFKKLGLPDREGYKVNFGEAQYDDTFKADFMDAAHKANMMPKQAEAMFGFWNEQINTATSNQATENTAASEAAMAKLKSDWGEGFMAEMGIAQQAVTQFADEASIEFLNNSGMATNPDMIRLFNKIGKSLSEDTFDRNVTKHLGMTKEEASEKANAIFANPEHAYWNASHPSHKAALADMLKYQGIAHS